TRHALTPYVRKPWRPERPPSDSMRARCLSSLTRSAAMLPALLQVALGLVPARAAEGAHVESSRHGDVVEIRAAADLAADRATAWRVLTDYGHYTAFIPGMSVSRVVST